MAKKLVTGKYLCSYCEQKFDSPSMADACRESHDIVYIPMTKTELNRLINGIMLGDLSIIPESLHTTLRKYQQTYGK